MFGPRQKKDGADAAVIPQFIDKFLKDEEIVINGSSEITRDFTPVSLVADVNCELLKTTRDTDNYYNVALGDSISLNQLIKIISGALPNKEIKTRIGAYREGDILHSCADISNISQFVNLSGYKVHDLIQELVKHMSTDYDYS